jgi:predicted nucleotidyltransferase
MIKIDKQKLKKISKKFNIELIVLFGSVINNRINADALLLFEVAQEGHPVYEKRK